MSVSEAVGGSAMVLDFKRGKIGDYQAGWRALIEGMSDKADEVTANFLRLVEERNVPDVKHATARMTENVVGEPVQAREYYVIERPYKNGAKCTLAVRAAPYGNDLYVEWLHYELGVVNTALILGVGCLGTIVTFGIGLLLFVPLYLWALAEGHLRRDMTHFEKQDSWALRAVVDACLRQAIDQAGIAKELVREVPGGQVDMKDKGWPRLI